jgi:hypothetical protein
MCFEGRSVEVYQVHGETQLAKKHTDNVFTLFQ